MLDGRLGRLSVPRHVVEQLDKASDNDWLDSIVKIEHDGEERYMANLEVFHNVHCLVRHYAPDTNVSRSLQTNHLFLTEHAAQNHLPGDLCAGQPRPA